jgi:single-stranded-DNA-specific exonuclease
MFDWELKSQLFDFESIKKELISEKLGPFTEEEFFNPKQPYLLLNERFFDTNLFDNIKIAKELIFKAVAENKLILIHGDYDADGVCATSILFQTIKYTLNYNNCFSLIPDRFEDGYGLSDKTVQKLLDLSFNQNFLLITVDCGITSVTQVAYLKSLGNQVIITDHHHKGDDLPDSDALIWSDRVVGSTLSWMLALGLGNKDPKYMSLAAIATVTDVFPLTGFNRSLLKHGLNILRTAPLLPIETILDFNNKNFKDIGVYEIGFVIGPRLNSSGRIGSADTSLELLNSMERDKAKEFVSVLNEVNLQRQKITEESISKVEIDSSCLPKIIICFNEDFHEGVMGLIASKLVQKYNRPALVVSSNDGKYKGSARSIKGINIIEILKEFKSEFISVGGHELAAGFSFESTNFEKIKSNLENYFERNFSNFNFNKKILITSEINLSLVNNSLLQLLEKMEPFGNGNEEPLFLTKRLKIKEIRFLGEKKNHLSLFLSDGIREIKGLYFNFDGKINEVFLGQMIDIVYKIRKNEYNGRTTIELNLVDFKKSDD